MKKIILAMFIATLFVSCETEVNQKYILNTSSTIENEGGLAIIENDFEELKTFYQLDSLNIQIERKEILISDEVKILFDPDICPCSLPKKVKRKLNKLKDEGKSWAPSYVVNYLNRFPQKATHLSGQSVTTLMHSLKIKAIDGTTRKWIVLGSPT